jgi:hypothetical protein
MSRTWHANATLAVVAVSDHFLTLLGKGVLLERVDSRVWSVFVLEPLA